jgi:hypothetical protein
MLIVLPMDTAHAVRKDTGSMLLKHWIVAP